VASSPAPAPRHRLRGFRLWEVAAFTILVVAVVVLGLRHGSTSRSGLQGSGNAATQTRSLPPFTQVELAGGNNVSVTVGPRQRVVVHADDNLLDHITTRVVNGRLVVGDRGSFTTSAPTSVDVAVPRLDSLSLTGGGVLTAASVHQRALSVTLPGGGVLRATGAVDRLDVVLAGGGDAELGGLVARDATVRLPGGGRVVVDATRSLDAAVSGAGVIVYAGNPRHVRSSVTGAGAITPGSTG